MLWRAKCINVKTGAESTVEVVAENYSRAYFEVTYLVDNDTAIVEVVEA